jgi:hypothetical protein
VYLPPTSPPTVIVDDSKTVRKLELRIAQLESELKLKDDDLRTRGVWQIKCTALEKANRSLEMESTSLQQKCYRLESQNKELDAELQNLIRHSKTKLNHLAYARQDLVEERDLLAVEVTDLERELVEGAAGVRAVKSQMQIRISDLEDELKELVATLRARDEEVKHLRMQLGDFDRLKSDNIKLIRETDRMAEEIHRLELELRDVGRLRAEINELRVENERLLLDAERYYKLKADYDRLLAELERLKRPEPDTRRPMLGVEIKMLDDAAGRKDCVVVVHSVTPNGPASQAGILPGDVLLAWDGIPLDSKAKFQRLLDQNSPGSKIVISALRRQSERNFNITVGAAAHGSFRQVRKVKSETQVDDFVQGIGAIPRVKSQTGRFN